jgi:hypothetical protein
MKNNIYRYSLLIIVFSLALAGCKAARSNPPTPTVDAAATQTQIAERTIAAVTVDAAMTESAKIDTPTVVEPSATPSERPTEEPTSTLAEIVVVLESPTPTSSATPEPTSTVILPTITSAPIDFRCNLVRTEPFYKAVLDRGEDFDVHWTLENSGTETWYYEYVTGRYRNGYELQRYRSSFNLTSKVEPGETYEVVIDMQAPYEPGEYSSIWILEHSKEAFCWFSVDIVVK